MLMPNTLLHQRYCIRQLIGQGGMGAVYQATDLHSGHQVALKHVAKTGRRVRALMNREAQLLASLRHPVLPRVHDFFSTSAGHFLVMDFVAGDDLATLIQRTRAPIALSEALGWADQLLDALEHMHTRQPPIVHRDIKPRNLKITPERQIMLLDFGLARSLSRSAAFGESVFGYTLAYAPPEQVRGEATDARSDLYALAATLYDLLTGQPPPDVLQRAAAVLSQLPDPLHPAHGLNPDVPLALAGLLQSALAISPAQRPPSAAAFRLALHAAADTQATAHTHIPAKPAALPKVPHNLPAPTTPLIGRARELAQLAELLHRPDVRLVSLTGTAGVGKTRLCLQAAEQVLAEFPDGIFLVQLAPIGDQSLLAPTIAATLGLRERAGQPLAETLKAHLRDKRLLLLLDNTEQILPSMVLAAELLAAAPSLKIVATSREVLRLRGEHEFAVQPLELPMLAFSQPLDQLRQVGAVELLLYYAQAAKREFALTAANAPLVAELCARLDGLPLALELAAARLRTLEPGELLAQLTRRLDLLVDGPRDLPARQQALRSAIAWSCDLLGDDERELFCCLGCFVGGLEPAAAEAVRFGPAMPPPNTQNEAPTVLAGLSALLSKNLIRPSVATEGVVRYTMLESIRAYAYEQLAASGWQEQALQRHAMYFLIQAERGAAGFAGPLQTAWLDTLERDHDNLRAALDYAQLSGQYDLALRIAAALGPFWLARGFLSEGRQRLRSALVPGGSVSARAKAHAQLGILSYNQSDLASAQEQHMLSLELYRSLDDRAGIAWALHQLGRIQREYAPAQVYLAESMALFRALGDQAGIAATLNELGGFERWAGAYESARNNHHESLAIYRQLGDVIGVAQSLRMLGSLADTLGQLDTAYQHFAESVAQSKAINDRHGWAWSLHHVSKILALQGARERARLSFAESRTLLREMGDQCGVAWSLHDQGRIELHRQPDLARTLLAESLARFRSLGDGWGIAWSLTILGKLLTSSAPEGARDYLAESVELHRQAGSQNGLVITLEGFARLAAAQAQPERAVRLYASAAAIRSATAAALPAAELQADQQQRAELHSLMGAPVYEASWARGYADTIEQAIECALEQL